MRSLVAPELIDRLTPEGEAQVVDAMVEAVLADPELTERLRELVADSLPSDEQATAS